MENKIRNIIKEQIKKLHEGIEDDEGRMAKSQMYKMQGYVNKLSSMLDDKTQLPSWVQSKLTKASDYMSAVFHYLEYEAVRDLKEELSLDQKAKLYYMMLLKKGIIDTLPEDPKAAYVQSMMDKPASSKFSEPMGETNDPEDDAEQEEWDKGWYGESLKEAASKLGYLNEDDMLNKIEKGVTAITGGGRRHASVSDRGDSIRVSFRYMRGEFDPEEWDKILKYLTGMGFEIKDEDNSYEPNYDREEPPEWVPTIHLKK